MPIIAFVNSAITHIEHTLGQDVGWVISKITNNGPTRVHVELSGRVKGAAPNKIVIHEEHEYNALEAAKNAVRRYQNARYLPADSIYPEGEG